MECTKNADGSYNIRLYSSNKEEILLAEAIATLSKDKWININDKLPEEGDWYFVVTHNETGKRIAQMLFLDSKADNFWLSIAGDWGNNITHWQPLPELPKEQP